MVKQYKANKLSILLGGAKEMFGRMSFYVQIFTMVMVAINFWDSGIMRNFRTDNEWLTFWLFVVIVGVMALIIMAFEYVFVMPGSYAFSTKQFIEHKNKMAEDVEDIKKWVDEQRKKEKA